MRTGFYISGIGHGLLFLWLIIGGLLSWSRDDVPLRVSEVSMISEDEFAALTAPKPQADAPEEAPAPEPAPAAPEVVPVPPARPEPEPTPEPVPEPAPEPEPEPAPQDVPRVAPEPAPEPEPQVEVAPDVVETPTPSPEASTPAPEEVIPTAPEAATTEIVTEATETAAPTKSVRPASRPNRPTPPVVAEPETPETPTPPAKSAANAVANAVSDAVAGGTQDVPDQDIPEGPPMSRGEKEGLRLAVKQCWNLGSTSSDALRTTVVVLVDMDRNGKPTNVALSDWDGPSQGAANTAFQAARRAVLICGRSGYDLPAEKYGQWRQIEMTFNPDKMRIK